MASISANVLSVGSHMLRACIKNMYLLASSFSMAPIILYYYFSAYLHDLFEFIARNQSTMTNELKPGKKSILAEQITMQFSCDSALSVAQDVHYIKQFDQF